MRRCRFVAPRPPLSRESYRTDTGTLPSVCSREGRSRQRSRGDAQLKLCAVADKAPEPPVFLAVEERPENPSLESRIIHVKGEKLEGIQLLRMKEHLGKDIPAGGPNTELLKAELLLKKIQPLHGGSFDQVKKREGKDIL